MPKILLIETATKFCGAGIAAGDGKVLSRREHLSDRYAHSEKLAVFVQELLQEAGTAKQAVRGAGIDAVAVSEGPGSYTGLRIGVSLAKGICYARNIPLIAVSTLGAMAQKARQIIYTSQGTNAHNESIEGDQQAVKAIYLPMMDARRDEVYMRAEDARGQELLPTRAVRLKELPLDEIVANANARAGLSPSSDHRFYYFGDGAEKAIPLLSEDDRFKHLANAEANLEGMAAIAASLYVSDQFRDVAYFEPYYLKDFVAIPSKKNKLK